MKKHEKKRMGCGGEMKSPFRPRVGCAIEVRSIAHLCAGEVVRNGGLPIVQLRIAQMKRNANLPFAHLCAGDGARQLIAPIGNLSLCADEPHTHHHGQMKRNYLSARVVMDCCGLRGGGVIILG